jgi:hypothetical protein
MVYDQFFEVNTMKNAQHHRNCGPFVRLKSTQYSNARKQQISAASLIVFATGSIPRHLAIPPLQDHQSYCSAER